MTQLGWLIERRFIQFKNDRKNPLCWGGAGLSLALMYCLNSFLPGLLAPLCGVNFAAMIAYICIGLFIFAVVPLALKLATNARQKKQADAETAEPLSEEA